jgi:hypothetical protein
MAIISLTSKSIWFKLKHALIIFNLYFMLLHLQCNSSVLVKTNKNYSPLKNITNNIDK